MRAIKALVIGLGAVIVLLVALVIWGIARQAESLREQAGFEELGLAMPAGCSLASVEAGRGDLILLRLEGPAERGCQQAILVDGPTGALAGRITLRPE